MCPESQTPQLARDGALDLTPCVEDYASHAKGIRAATAVTKPAPLFSVDKVALRITSAVR